MKSEPIKKKNDENDYRIYPLPPGTDLANVYFEPIVHVPVCEQCHYWDKTSAQIGGCCHRWPEGILKLGSDWCGEFRRKEEKTE